MFREKRRTFYLMMISENVIKNIIEVLTVKMLRRKYISAVVFNRSSLLVGVINGTHIISLLQKQFYNKREQFTGRIQDIVPFNL